MFDLATAAFQQWLADALAHPWATFFQFTPGMLSIVSTWLYGNRSLSGPVVGVVSQVCWLGFIVTHGTWLMLPMFVFFMGVHVRNLAKWLALRRRESTDGHQDAEDEQAFHEGYGQSEAGQCGEAVRRPRQG